jgi:penicillin amidase
VSVHRDRWGVPHVVGDDLADLARLQGTAAVEDRADQLELTRRKAEGRLAEVLGEGQLAWDVLARRADLVGLARRSFEGSDAETQTFFASYAEGVSAALPDGHAPWEPWTPMAVFAAHHLLFASFPTKLWREHLARHLEPEQALVFNDEGLWLAGSNSWVVGGDRTRSGLPVIGGDPHRTFEAPNCYAQVRLTCEAEGIDVAGFTFPGVPGVQHFAHAGDVAWGITNAMGDYQDLYLERFEQDEDGTVRALGPDLPEAVESRLETVVVRDQLGPVEVEALRTPRGPVVLLGQEPGTAYSLRWPADVLGDLGLGAVVPLLRARSVGDVLAALEGWVEPVNNLLVADTSGAIRQQVVGRVPRRAEENRWRPVPADDPAAAWDGWVDLPGRDVATDEHLATANHRMPGFEVVGVEFAPPARADRITFLLDGRDDVDATVCAEVHGDVMIGHPAPLLDALFGLHGLAGATAELQAELVGWDRRMTADSTTAAAYVDVRDAFVARLAAVPPFDAIPRSPHPAYLDAWFELRTQLWLSLANLFSDEGATVVPDREEHLRAALEDVAARERRTWGSRHRYRPFALGGESPHAEPELPGDNDCVRCAGQLPGTEVASRGSVARYAWDLGGLDRSGWVVPRGAHGDPDDPHHHDQLEAWLDARLLPVVGSD